MLSLSSRKSDRPDCEWLEGWLLDEGNLAGVAGLTVARIDSPDRFLRLARRAAALSDGLWSACPFPGEPTWLRPGRCGAGARQSDVRRDDHAGAAARGCI